MDYILEFISSDDFLFKLRVATYHISSTYLWNIKTDLIYYHLNAIFTYATSVENFPYTAQVFFVVRDTSHRTYILNTLITNTRFV